MKKKFVASPQEIKDWDDFTKEMKDKGNQVDFFRWKDNGHQFFRWDKKAYPEVMEKLILFIKEQSS